MIRDGKYSIPEEQGPNVGKYTVQIVGYEKAPAVTAEGEEDEAEDEGSADLGKQVINTTKEVEIVSGPNTHDFALKSQ